MKTTFIYALCEPGTRTVRYIGKADNLKRRIRQHLGQSVRKKNHLGCWLKSLASRGESPVLIVLKEVFYCDWPAEEIQFIKEARKSGTRLVNSTEGGEGMINPSLELREKLRQAHKGVALSKECRRNMSLSRLGKPLSEEHRRNISKGKLGLKGSSPSEATRKKLSEAGKGRLVSEHTRQKISAALTGNPLSEEHKAKISASHRARNQEGKGS